MKFKEKKKENKNKMTGRVWEGWGNKERETEQRFCSEIRGSHEGFFQEVDTTSKRRGL